MNKYIFIFLIALLITSRSETILIGAEDDWPPYSKKANDRAEGIAVDIVNMSFNAVGISVKTIALPCSRCIKSVINNELVACFNTAKTKENEHKLLWPKNPIFNSIAGIYSLLDSNYSNLSIKDLEGKVVGVTNGYEYSAEFDKNKKIIRNASSSDYLGFKKLLYKRFKYMIAEERVAKYLEIKNRCLFENKFKLVGGVGSANIYIAFSKKYKNSEELAAKFDEGISKIHKNGEYDKILAKWLLRPTNKTC